MNLPEVNTFSLEKYVEVAAVVKRPLQSKSWMRATSMHAAVWAAVEVKDGEIALGLIKNYFTIIVLRSMGQYETAFALWEASRRRPEL